MLCFLAEGKAWVLPESFRREAVDPVMTSGLLVGNVGLS
jgi:hypothetical protein